MSAWSLVVALPAVGALMALVWRRPVAGAVLLVFVTPLVAGIDRGRLIPVLRPNEALVLLVAGVLLLRWLCSVPTGVRWHLSLTRIEKAMVAMAVANSVLPLLVMTLRGQAIEPDDITYALVLWKYLMVYAAVRACVRTQREVMMCLVAAMSAAVLVSVVGILQALDLAGARAALVGYYAPYGYTGALAAPRGGSTLGLPAATADLLIMNLAVAIGLWWRSRRHGFLLLVVSMACVGGSLAAAEFSSALGLVLGVATCAVVCRRYDVLKLAPFGAAAAVVALWPVIEHRLAGFESATGLPVSWTTRLSNLQNYFLPDLLAGTNPLLGVRPAARVAVDHQGTGFVWIESGYLWLLWGGGLPLLAAFVWFVAVALRDLVPLARPVDSYSSVAALGACTGVVVVAALMVFDPHLTYRGSADWLFSLLALSNVRGTGVRGARVAATSRQRFEPLPASAAPSPLVHARGGVS